MTTIFETPLLTATTSKGHSKYWQGFVVTDDTNYFTKTVSYQDTASGAKSTPLVSTPKLIQGKNIGKANETSPKDQAVAEITSAMNLKKDKGYFEHGQEEPERLPLPMLAHSFTKRAHDMTFPCYVQPKLDGTRMLFDGTKGWSRQGKLYIPEVIAHLQCRLPADTILDGELMLDHTQYTFQETVAAIKKFRPDVTPQLQYYVYDVLLEGKSFEYRYAYLKNALAKMEPADVSIVLVPTLSVSNQEEMLKMHEVFVGQGFEGTILRNVNGLYKTDHRSADLQKYKDFVDEEFEIVDVTEGVAKEEGCAVFICKSQFAKNGASLFNVRPKGTNAERRQMYDDREELIGKKLSVRYQNLSDDGIPRFPVGIAVRDYEG